MEILLLEDDSVLASLLNDYLNEHYHVTHAYTVQEARAASSQQTFELFIFDINVPDGSGITLLQELRAFQTMTPAIMITAYDAPRFIKEAFESGCDDYIKKPFELEELRLRIENIRRHYALNSRLSLFDGCSFEPAAHLLYVNEHTIALSKKESALLHYLFSHRPRIISSQELLQTLWRYDEMPSDDAIRTLVKTLRHHLGKAHIVNVRAQGYRFE